MMEMFFDIYLTGHHSEYVGHLVNYLVNNQNNAKKYTFILHPEFRKSFPHIIENANHKKNIEFLFVSEGEWKIATMGSLSSQSFAQFDLVNSYAKKYSADVVYLLHINVFQLALIFRRPSFKIKGILFSQFTRQDRAKGTVEKLRYFRRFLQTYLLTKNSTIDSIFLLNDKTSCMKLNSKFSTNIFKFLPDPIPEINLESIIPIREVYNIPETNKIFLHFGVLTARKGTLDILKSISNISQNAVTGITLFLAGSVDNPETLNQIEMMIASIGLTNIVQVVFVKGFVSNNLKNNLFMQSDLVLIPYKNVEASSGVFNHAVAAGKFVAGYKQGLLGEMISNYKLGIIIDNTIDFLELKKHCSDMQVQLEKSNSDQFSKILLED